MGDTNNTSLNTSALVAGMGADFTACVLGLSQPTAEELRKCYDMEISNHLKQMTESVDELKGNLDMFFLIVLAIIIYLMQGGFAILECGAVRSKNATNILTKNMLDAFIGALAYWFTGYALAFGNGNAFCGTEFWALKGEPPVNLANWFYHYTFAATAATIVSGAVAERCEFAAYFVYSAAITGFMYPIVAHWAWSEQGWLAQGLSYTYQNETYHAIYRDFSGSGAVHWFSGIAALVAAAFLGPRLGRFDKDGKPVEIRGHSIPLQALGGFILIFGFFAFNVSANGNITGSGSGETIARSVVNTVISGSFSAFTCIVCLYVYQRWKGGKPTLSLCTTINSALAGMVAVCSGVNVYPIWAAAVVGGIEGFNYLFWSWLMLKVHIDDPLDAIAVHAGGGVFGLLIAPFFIADEGIVYNWDIHSAMLLVVNIVGLLAITAWTAILSMIMFAMLSCLDMLRVDPEIEMKGLDIPKHGEPAYPAEAYSDGWHHAIKRRRSTLANIIFRRTSNDANEPTPTSSRPTVAPVLEEEEPQESGAKSHTINGQAHPGATFAPEASAVEGNVANSSGKDPLDPLSWYSKL